MIGPFQYALFGKRRFCSRGQRSTPVVQEFIKAVAARQTAHADPKSTIYCVPVPKIMP
jgi:hypothetical protein